MASKVRKVCLLIAVLLIVTATLTACHFGNTLEGDIEKYDLKAKITYHGNGGFINDNDALEYAYVYYKEGDNAFNIGTDTLVSGTLFIKRENYTLLGWYYPAKNDDGTLKYTDEEKGIVAVDKEFDFANYKAKEGDDIDLYALWLPNQKVEYILAAEESINNQLVVGDKTYTVGGEALKIEDFGTKDSISQPSKDPFFGAVADNYTWAGYYEDPECTIPVTWPVHRTTEEGNIKIYAKYLSKDWTVINNADDFLAIFGAKATSTSKYYVGNENVSGKYYIAKDITFGTDYLQVAPNSTFSGVIRGNGHTLSGLKVQTFRVSSTISLFGNVTSGAKIEDIILQNCNVSYTLANNAYINAYLFASSIDEGATISNVVIDGGSIKVNAGATGALWINKSTNIVELINAGTLHSGITVAKDEDGNYKCIIK